MTTIETQLAWAMAVGVGLCNGGVALAAKGAEQTGCRAMPVGFVTFAVAGATALLVAMLGGVTGWGDWRLWAFGASMGLLYVAGTPVMLRANGCWPPSIVWSTANMAFVMPILLSALCLGEPLRWMDALIVAGVAVMLAGLAEPGGAGTTDKTGRRISSRQRWLLLAIVFALNGAMMLGFKLFGILLPGRSSSCLVTAIYGSGAVMALAAQAFRGKMTLSRNEFKLGLGCGAAMSLAALALLAAMRLPAATAFPVIQGTSLAAGVCLCAVVFREHLTPRKLAALAIGLGAMILTVWR